MLAIAACCKEEREETEAVDGDGDEDHKIEDAVAHSEDSIRHSTGTQIRLKECGINKKEGMIIIGDEFVKKEAKYLHTYCNAVKMTEMIKQTRSTEKKNTWKQR